MNKEEFQNDYRHMLDVLNNKRPKRLPVYEHIISAEIMEKVLNVKFSELFDGGSAELDEYFKHYCRFFKEMTYDTVSFEVCITEILPEHGAIMGGRPGPIQTWADFNNYPCADLPKNYWKYADQKFRSLKKHLPPGMLALGGVGNGVFEISEDLVGFEHLAYLKVDEPELFSAIYQKIGDLMVDIWIEFLNRYSDIFVICRMGDDLGFKSGTLVSPTIIRQFVFPQYKRVIDQIKAVGKPFLWHSCGKIFSVMDDAIRLGIDAKHSNEDTIASFDHWIELYGGKIGLLGGIDVDILCQRSPDQIITDVFDKGNRFRNSANGYALGSGNSIPEYIPVDGYLAMIEAAQKIRAAEKIE